MGRPRRPGGGSCGRPKGQPCRERHEQWWAWAIVSCMGAALGCTATPAARGAGRTDACRRASHHRQPGRGDGRGGWVSFWTAFLVLIGLVMGTYVVAVLGRLASSRPLRVTDALLAPLTEAGQLLRQQNTTPRNADTLLFRSAPLVALVSV